MAALACAVALMGCPRRKPPPPRPRVPRVQPAEAARRAVVAYMRHLQDGDYAAAHALLSAESRRRHPLDEFTRQAQEGITYFDLSSARAKLTAPGHAQVALQLEDDPSGATISVVQEGSRPPPAGSGPPAGGKWRVVYRGGRPGFPYP
jgi:hypothetical protein